MNVDMSERQCPSFVSYHLGFTSWGISFLNELLDDGGGRDRVDYALTFASQSIYHVKSRLYLPSYIHIYAFIHSPLLFSLLIEILIVLLIIPFK
jgi:hypothetical protein